MLWWSRWYLRWAIVTMIVRQGRLYFDLLSVQCVVPWKWGRFDRKGLACPTDRICSRHRIHRHSWTDAVVIWFVLKICPVEDFLYKVRHFCVYCLVYELLGFWPKGFFYSLRPKFYGAMAARDRIWAHSIQIWLLPLIDSLRSGV